MYWKHSNERMITDPPDNSEYMSLLLTLEVYKNSLNMSIMRDRYSYSLQRFFQHCLFFVVIYLLLKETLY